MCRNLKTDGPYPAEVAGFGIGIFAEADTIVSGNVVEGAPQYGIGMGWGPYLRNVMARGNILRDCGDGISVTVAEGAGPAVISDNIIARPCPGCDRRQTLAGAGERAIWRKDGAGAVRPPDHPRQYGHDGLKRRV